MKTTLIKAEEYGLNEKQVIDVNLAFSEKVKEREIISEVYNQIIQKDIDKAVSKEARELRLKAVKLKSNIANVHKTQKEYALAFGKYCDAWKRKETEPVQQIIDGLLEIEKFEEIQEQKRINELQASRVKQLSPYVEDAHMRNLATMEDDVWEVYFITKKKEYQDRIEAEKKAEEERIAKEKAEAEERERIRLENEKLRAEAEERQRIEEERLKKEAIERQEREEKERKEREEYEAKIRAEREERERIEREEREKREKVEAELRAKEEAERKAKEKEQARIQAELNKGDADKVKDLIGDLETIKTKYSFKSEKNKKMYSDVSNLLEKVINHIKK